MKRSSITNSKRDQKRHKTQKETSFSFAKRILNDSTRFYANKKEAVDICHEIAISSQIRKAYVMSRWMFDTIPGSLIMGNAILRACSDIALPYV